MTDHEFDEENIELTGGAWVRHGLIVRWEEYADAS